MFQNCQEQGPTENAIGSLEVLMSTACQKFPVFEFARSSFRSKLGSLVNDFGK